MFATNQGTRIIKRCLYILIFDLKIAAKHIIPKYRNAN